MSVFWSGRSLCVNGPYLLALGAFLCLGSAPIGAQFSVEEALSAPFTNQLTAAPAKARVAWFTDQEGRRNVWVAGSHEAARTITDNTADDGQDIDDIAWSRDGERLAWTRGTGPAGSEHTMAANPAELPGPVRQHVEWIDLREERQGHKPVVHMVQDGHTPLFAADGSHLIFLRRGAIWIADLGSATPATPSGTVSSESRDQDAPKIDAHAPVADDPEPAGSTSAPPHEAGVRQLLFVRGAARGLRLSPDGTQLAFVSGRGDHSFVGVYTFAARALTWMDPGTGLDHDPVWSPGGKQIAFVREVPIVSPIADRWMRDGAPWSIRIADVQTGSGHERWHADAGPGSLFHEVSARDQLIWTEGGSLLFPWEKTGFVQLYHVATQGDRAAEPASFAPAGAAVNWEVDSVAADGKRVVFSANEHGSDAGDAERRHLWFASTGAGDAPPIPLTSGREIETSPAMLSDGGIAYLQGGTTEPLTPVLSGDPMHRSMTGSMNLSMNRLAPQLAFQHRKGDRFIEPYFTQPEAVSFAAADGMPVRGQLFLPRACLALPQRDSAHCAHLPAVVFFHGGSRRQMLLGFHPMQYYAQAYEFNQYLASRGFAVLSVNYRSGTGYGLNFRQALNYGANGASEDNDVVGAAKYLQSRPEVDPHRIGAWGGSYGGYLTALALARHSDLYAAGVDLHGVHDWSLELDLWKPTDEPGVDQAAIARRAFQSSPMASVNTWKSPVLLMQGDDDRNVLFAQTVRMAAELRSRGVHVEEKVFPDEVHDFLLHRNWIDAYRLAAEFLERNLKTAPSSATAP
ncbi:S9 family peptidase [Terriglobus sp.]|uniref:S9 family peptidase n=1 Tax=Terriglobus sp. TaxID=1889013 RepID=UPI003AFFA26B